MSDGVHHVVFFGTIVATIIGQEVYSELEFGKLESQGAFVKLRLGVCSAFEGLQEVLSSTSTSGPYELHSEIDATNLHLSSQYLTVMLERNQDAGLGASLCNEECLDEDSEDEMSVRIGAHLHRADVVVSVGADVFCGDCKHDLISTKQVYLRSLAGCATKDTCCVVRIIISQLSKPSSTEPLASHEAESTAQSRSDDQNAVAAIYVMLRVVDLSRNLSNALDADVQLRRRMCLPQPQSRWDLSETRKIKVPYGVMPLSQLYDQYRNFFSKYYCINIRPSAGVMQALQTAHAETNTPYPYRWCRLKEITLDRLMLGEKGFAPILLTLSHCPNLSFLNADGNGLGDLPCAWLFALFHKHRYLHTVSFKDNIIYEGGADQLLRLARRNHQITKFQLSDNPCSQLIMERIERVTKCNLNSIQADPLNLLSPAYSEVITPASIPVPITIFALETWSMLAAAPIGDIDVWVRNSTTTDMDLYEDSSISGRSEAFEAAKKAPAIGIPLIARAPLLSEIIRTVYIGITAAIEDPVVRSVFMDIQALHLQWKELKDKNHDKLGSPETNIALNSSAHENGESAMFPIEEEKEVNGNNSLPNEIKRIFEKCTVCNRCSMSEPLVLTEGEEEIYQASFLNIIVTTFRGLSGTSRWADVVQILQRIGERQRELGVQDEDYWLAANLFMKSLQVSLGNEERAPKMLSAFFNVLVLGVRTAVGSPIVGKT